ncbi:nucleoside-diphosphate kinase [candidate division TA06 bacterium]|nr:nucleoside-diphosphate kinase [candidate division TA06 bacterium]
MERTLFIIKPDGVERKVVGEVIRRIEKEGFQILQMKMLRMTKQEAERLYAIHRDKEFYSSLIEFILSGSVVLLLLERQEAISKLRELAGKTNPAEAGKGTIRGDFGTTIQNNIVHASDSIETAEREITIFFP